MMTKCKPKPNHICATSDVVGHNVTVDDKPTRAVISNRKRKAVGLVNYSPCVVGVAFEETHFTDCALLLPPSSKNKISKLYLTGKFAQGDVWLLTEREEATVWVVETYGGKNMLSMIYGSAQANTVTSKQTGG